MRSKYFAVAVLAALLLNVTGLSADNSRRHKAKKRTVSRLVTLLPASDGIAVFDSKRFLTDGLPRVLAANQPVLGRVTEKLAEIESRTGIDLRKFDQVAVGVSYRQVSPSETDYDTVVLASGDVSAGALVAVAKMASDGTYREEKAGSRSIFIFTPKAVVQKTTVQVNNSRIAAAVDKLTRSLNKEIAIASLDRNTLAIGTPARVRETLEGATHTTADVTGLLTGRADPVASFAFRTPAGATRLLPVDNDDLGRTIGSIQYVAGSMDVTATGASVQMLARTKTAEQAVALKDTLDGLQIIGGAVLGGSKRPQQQVYGRMVKNAKFGSTGTDVTIDLAVPQSDIDALIADIK